MKNRTYFIVAVLFLVPFVTFLTYGCGGGGGGGSSGSSATLYQFIVQITNYTASTLTIESQQPDSSWQFVPGGTITPSYSASVAISTINMSSVNLRAKDSSSTIVATKTVSGDTTWNIGSASLPATKLAFISQPTTTAAGSAFSPGISVAVKDANNNTVTSATNSITIAVTQDSGFALSTSLGGTLTRNAVNGIANFTAVTVGGWTEVNYTLTASASGLTSAQSNGFGITFGPFYQYVIGFDYYTVPRPSGSNQTGDIEAQDVYGNTVETATNTFLMGIQNIIGTTTLYMYTDGTYSTGTTTYALTNGLIDIYFKATGASGNRFRIAASRDSGTTWIYSAYINIQ